MLFEEGIGFLYYVGDMNKDQKNAAITEFQDKDHIKVLVSFHLARGMLGAALEMRRMGQADAVTPPLQSSRRSAAAARRSTSRAPTASSALTSGGTQPSSSRRSAACTGLASSR